MIEIIRNFFFDYPETTKWVLTPTEAIRTHKDAHCFYLEDNSVVVSGEDLHIIKLKDIVSARICPGNGALEIKTDYGLTVVVYAD